MSLAQKLYALCLLSCPLILISCGLLWPGGYDSLPQDGLIAYYPFDGSAIDVVGGYNGVLVGAASARDRFGVAGRALQFDGDDYIRVDESEAFDFDLREEGYTISLWAKADDPAGLARLVVKWNELTSSPYPFQVNQVNGAIWGSIYDTQQTVTAVAEDAWMDGWKHMLVKYDSGENQLTLYVDGEIATAVQAVPNADTRNESPVYIGRAAPPREDRYFEGSLDALRIYERPLTDEEIEALYDEGR